MKQSLSNHLHADESEVFCINSIFSVPQTIISLCLSHHHVCQNSTSSQHLLDIHTDSRFAAGVCERRQRRVSADSKLWGTKPNTWPPVVACSMFFYFLCNKKTKKNPLQNQRGLPTGPTLFWGVTPLLCMFSVFQGVSWIDDAQVCFWPCLKPGLEIYMAF